MAMVRGTTGRLPSKHVTARQDQRPPSEESASRDVCSHGFDRGALDRPHAAGYQSIIPRADSDLRLRERRDCRDHRGEQRSAVGRGCGAGRLGPAGPTLIEEWIVLAKSSDCHFQGPTEVIGPEALDTIAWKPIHLVVPHHPAGVAQDESAALEARDA